MSQDPEAELRSPSLIRWSAKGRPKRPFVLRERTLNQDTLVIDVAVKPAFHLSGNRCLGQRRVPREFMAIAVNRFRSLSRQS